MRFQTCAGRPEVSAVFSHAGSIVLRLTHTGAYSTLSQPGFDPFKQAPAGGCDILRRVGTIQRVQLNIERRNLDDPAHPVVQMTGIGIPGGACREKRLDRYPVR